MDAQTLQDQAETIAILRYVLEENAKLLHKDQASALKSDVESFIPRIIQHWEDDEMVNGFISHINFQYTKRLWMDVTLHSTK
ncbi:hypothetical protein NIES4071_00520 [Calothrix sp. NIES-4071]|nr:hypothetical protein NIES4071_00520 [Calothrix sp. NIES-4071]BAZ54398.1 hypothetical protein NIES4105_00510 [Calothrix sp. NIES-4105]